MSSKPWNDLVVLAERECELVRAGRWDDAVEASASRLRAAQALGDPPASARPALERLAALQHDIHADLTTGRAFTLHKLGELRRSHAAARGYAGIRPSDSTVDGRA